MAVTDISLSRERSSDVLEVYTSTCSPTSTSLTRSASMSMISAAAAYSLDDGDLQTTMHSYNNIGENRIDVRGLNREKLHIYLAHLSAAHNLPGGLFKTIVFAHVLKLENIMDGIFFHPGRNKVSGHILKIMYQ